MNEILQPWMMSFDAIRDIMFRSKLMRRGMVDEKLAYIEPETIILFLREINKHQFGEAEFSRN